MREVAQTISTASLQASGVGGIAASLRRLVLARTSQALIPIDIAIEPATRSPANDGWTVDVGDRRLRLHVEIALRLRPCEKTEVDGSGEDGYQEKDAETFRVHKFLSFVAARGRGPSRCFTGMLSGC